MELAGAHLSMATLMQDNAPLQSMAEEKVYNYNNFEKKLCFLNIILLFVFNVSIVTQRNYSYI